MTEDLLGKAIEDVKDLKSRENTLIFELVRAWFRGYTHGEKRKR